MRRDARKVVRRAYLAGYRHAQKGTTAQPQDANGANGVGGGDGTSDGKEVD